jgi:hypothetical protein
MSAHTMNRHDGFSRSMGLVYRPDNGGHAMINKRTCTRCHQKKPQKGGTNSNGRNFVCADCKPKVVA